MESHTHKRSFLARMYLRAYARCLASHPSKSPDDLAHDAAFRVAMTLTAPLLALSMIGAAAVNRFVPGTFTRSSGSAFAFVAAVMILSFGVRAALSRRFGHFPIPKGVETVYGTQAQRAVFLLETIFAIGCIVVAGLLVGVIQKQ